MSLGIMMTWVMLCWVQQLKMLAQFLLKLTIVGEITLSGLTQRVARAFLRMKILFIVL